MMVRVYVMFSVFVLIVSFFNQRVWAQPYDELPYGNQTYENLESDNEDSGDVVTIQIMGSFGMGYAHTPEMDSWVGDMASSFENWGNTTPAVKDTFSTESEMTSRFSFGFDAELRIYIYNIGIGASYGYHMSRSTANVTSTYYSDEASSELEFAIKPLLFTLYYRIAMSQNSFFVIGAGAGYYDATMSANYEAQSVTIIDTSFDVTSIGYHVKLEYNGHFGDILFWYAGVMGRYVTFDSFKNDQYELLKDGNPFETSFSGVDLYVGIGLNF